MKTAKDLLIAKQAEYIKWLKNYYMLPVHVDFESEIFVLQMKVEQKGELTLREELIRFVKAITIKTFPYVVCYESNKPFATSDKDYNCEYIVDEYLKSR